MGNNQPQTNQAQTKGIQASEGKEQNTSDCGVFTYKGEGRCRDVNNQQPKASIYINLKSIPECQNRCRNTDGCIGIQYLGAHNHCWLYGDEFQGSVNFFQGSSKHPTKVLKYERGAACYDFDTKMAIEKRCIIFTGTVGVGKSTLCSKIIPSECIESQISGSSKTSFTTESAIYEQADIIIIDTPGTNPKSSKKLNHNMHIASAFAAFPVSLLCVVVSSHIRISQVLSDLEKPLVAYSSFSEIICPVITHMDDRKLEWGEAEFRKDLFEEYGVSRVIFTDFRTSGQKVRKDLVANFQKPIKLDITGDTFFKYFATHGRNINVLKVTKDLVDEYQKKARKFWEIFKTIKEMEKKKDLVFEFQNYMLDQIPSRQQILEQKCDFKYEEKKDQEYAFQANLRNQLKSALYDIRLKAMKYQKAHGLGSLRKCPHCQLIYTKVEGCSGYTTCGNISALSESSGIFYSYTFTWMPFTITPSANRSWKKEKRDSAKTIGCGKTINWKQMQCVEIPEELEDSSAVISTDDVSVLSNEAQEYKDDLSFRLVSRQASLKNNKKLSKKTWKETTTKT